MSIFEGLQSYEVVLLIMGVLLFLVLLGLLIYCVLQKRPYTKLCLLFPVPIVMVGFPGIQKFSFNNGVMEVEKLTREVEKNPQNVEAKRQLEVQLKGIGDRPVSQPDSIRILERAYSAVGNQQRANEFRARLPAVKPIR